MYPRNYILLFFMKIKIIKFTHNFYSNCPKLCNFKSTYINEHLYDE